MAPGVAPVAVVLYTLALAVGVITFLFVGAFLMGRYVEIKTRGAWEVTRQVMELEAKRSGTAPRWRRCRFFVGPIAVLLVLVTLATNHSAFALPIVLVALPAGAIVYGLEIREVGYVTLSLPLQPTRLLRGLVAVRVWQPVRYWWPDSVLFMHGAGHSVNPPRLVATSAAL